ncbi:MAG: hypothetical protein AAFV07_17030, partial [Bacteroidota bacterium]
MYIRSLFILILLSILSSGCKVDEVPPQLDMPLTLAYGESAFLEDRNLKITFRDVLEDGRCPTGTACVDAGSVKVLLALQEGDLAEQRVELSLPADPDIGSQELTPTPFSIYVKLLEVSPYPEEDRFYAEKRYEIVILV